MNVDHYDLTAWIFNLCIIIAIMLGVDVALRIYELFYED